MAEYRLSPAAEYDLELIWTYTVRQWGVEQPDRYLDFLVAAFDKLAESPKQRQAVSSSGKATAGGVLRDI